MKRIGVLWVLVMMCLCGVAAGAESGAAGWNDPKVLIALGGNLLALAVMWGRLNSTVAHLNASSGEVKKAIEEKIFPAVTQLRVDVEVIKQQCKDRGATC